MQLRYLDSALDDLLSITLYIEEVSGYSAAQAVIDGITSRCERITSLAATLGTDRSELRPGIRSTPHRNYVILFRYVIDAIEVVNILHASRDIRAHYPED